MTVRREHAVKRGLIQVKVRCRQYRTGIRFSIRTSRLFKDGDVWRESQRFGRDDIPVLRLALDEAHTWMLTQSLRETRQD